MGDRAHIGEGFMARRLAHLIAELHPAGRGPYTPREIEDLIKKSAGPGDPTVTHATIANIRTGKVTNPSLDSMRALAKFFGVSTSYFVDEEVAEATDRRMREIKEGVELAKASDDLAEVLEDSHVRAIAFRLRGLSAKTLKGIQGMVEGARDLEGLPAVDEKPGRRRKK
ncbi:helix-turn-helix transcriptional regulator [Streptomyces sp. NBC_01298]|uniref:helix-turn-helix domain-containing protein n=1 Tax=Streptomyces sp. NBC_01298 TaxID=2903817 RepID=UPI002E12E9E0|nr:helix-turn-helix transcriptional regulator [Streptomyces sp. NBC_01298]